MTVWLTLSLSFIIHVTKYSCNLAVNYLVGEENGKYK
jgi:hypothetical protein